MKELIFTKDELLEMYKLKNIVRYNHRTRLKDENVAEHSFFTALIALDICKKLSINTHDTFKVIIKCLLHDTPEEELNDVTYDVKLKLNLRPLLKEFEDKYFEDNYPDYANIMTNNDNNIVNAIVNYADAMSVLQYAYNEIELGNTTFAPIVTETLERLEKLRAILLEVYKK